MRFIFLLIWAVVVAGGVGAGSAYYLIQESANLGSVTVGSWRAWPSIGNPDADPYSRAMQARAKSIPMGTAEGLAFSATTSNSGAPLDKTCSYRLVGTMPRARLWTLILSEPDGTPILKDQQRSAISGLHSRDILRQPDGSVRIQISPTPQPDNWIRLDGKGPFKITVRLYDAALTAASRFNDVSLPRLIEEACL